MKKSYHDLEKNIKNAAMILFSGVNYYTGQFYDVRINC